MDCALVELQVASLVNYLHCRFCSDRKSSAVKPSKPNSSKSACSVTSTQLLPLIVICCCYIITEIEMMFDLLRSVFVLHAGH